MRKPQQNTLKKKRKPTKKEVRQAVRRATEKIQEQKVKKVKDEKKVFNKKAFDAVEEQLQRFKKKFSLPSEVKMERKPMRTTVMVINREGKQRELLPDKQPKHLLLCHRKMAKVFSSGVCMFNKITAHQTESGEYIDGSWAITPCLVDMANVTTIQHVRRRRFFFLHRYWYQISFDGHVQPAMMLADYRLDPEKKSQRFFVTREYVKVRRSDITNDYFRIWKQYVKRNK